MRDDRRLVYDAARAAREDASMAAAPPDPAAAARRKERFDAETKAREEPEEPKVTGAKRRRRGCAERDWLAL